MATKHGGAGADVLRGTNANDWLYGNDGNDRIDGFAGNDAIFGGAGRDTLNGGSGSDYVDGGVGDDVLIYSMSENRGAYDVYNGWFGNDTLRLAFTAAEWARADVKADVARFLAYLPEYNEPLGWVDDPVFSFRSFGLSVVGVNKLEVVVDGKVINPADAPVVTAADALALTEDDAAGATVDLLANDWAADGVQSVSFTQPATGAVELVSTDFAAEKPSAVVRFTPNAGAFDHLAAGQTATETFSYTVVDKDGDAKTETVTVTITGTNDGPVAVADAATVAEDDLATGSVAANDRDVDSGDTLAYALTATAPAGFAMASDGTWTLDASDVAYQDLAAGETRVVTADYTVADAVGATATATLTLTVTGTNDAPVVTAFEDGAVSEDDAQDFDFSYETGEFVEYAVAEGTVAFADADGRGTASVTVADAPEGYLGEFTAELAEDGVVTWRFRVDNAQLQYLGEQEELVQTYQVVIDDGQGGSTTQAITVRVDGMNDDVEREETENADLTDSGGIRSGVTRLYFSDLDLTDVHSATIFWRDEGNVGEVTASVVQIGEDGRGYVDVLFNFPIDEIEALPSDQLEQRYRVVISDGNGDTLTINRVVTLDRRVEWSIGGAGDDGIFATSSVGNVLIGNGGRDQLYGDSTDDQLFGDFGPGLPAGEPDRLEGESEGYGYPGYDEFFDDVLDGGAGADLLVGGEGADIFQFSIYSADEDGDGLRDFTVADGDVVRDFNAEEGDVLVFNYLGEGATFTRLDDTRYEVASADRSIVEVIIFENGADVPASSVFFYY